MKEPEKRLNPEIILNNQETKSEMSYKMIDLQVKSPIKIEKIYKNLVPIVYNGQIKDKNIAPKNTKNNNTNSKPFTNLLLLNYSEITECNHEKFLQQQKIFNKIYDL